MYCFRENSNFPFSNQKIITLVHNLPEERVVNECPVSGKWQILSRVPVQERIYDPLYINSTFSCGIHWYIHPTARFIPNSYIWFRQTERLEFFLLHYMSHLKCDFLLHIIFNTNVNMIEWLNDWLIVCLLLIDALIKRVSVINVMKCTRIGEKRCNSSCFQINQEMDAILLIIGIVLRR
jgi:hypothetical protein